MNEQPTPDPRDWIPGAGYLPGSEPPPEQQDEEPAHDGGPSVAEAAADDASHWNGKYDRP